MKMKDKLKEVKTQLDDIMKKLTNFTEIGDNYKTLFSLYEKGYDKYTTDDLVRLVKGNFTKFFVIDHEFKIKELHEIHSKVNKDVDNIKVVSSAVVNADYKNLFKLIHKLEKADYVFKFKFSMELALKPIPNTEDLKVSGFNELQLKASLRTKDYKFLMEDVFKGNKSNFEIEDLPTFDINLPKDGKLVCDNCKAKN